jgi:hypothetical protein
MSVIDEIKKYKNILNEARIGGDPDIAYTMGAKTKKAEGSGDFDSVTAQLSGMKEKIPNKLAEKSLELKNTIESLEDERVKLHATIGEGSKSIFDASDAVLTRYIETSKAIITLSKETQDIASAEESVDYEKVLQEIYKLVSKKLIPEIELIVKNNTKVIQKVKKGSATKVMVRTKEPKIESINEDTNEFSNWFNNYEQKVVARMEQYDRDLNNIMSNVP